MMSPPQPHGLLVSGTDTGAGKTVLSAALISAIARAGMQVDAYKPVVTGLDEQADWPHDHRLLADVAGMAPDQVSPLRFADAVSPHLAAELAGRPVRREQILAGARAAARRAAEREAVLIVEGVGGLMVPLSDDLSVRDLACELSLPMLIAARAGLGTINHTLLTIEAARSAGLAATAVVLTPWPEDPSPMQLSNRKTIERLGQIEVAGLARVSGPNAQELAEAGSKLPWRRWLLDAEPANP